MELLFASICMCVIMIQQGSLVEYKGVGSWIYCSSESRHTVGHLVFTAKHLTDTDKQNCTGEYRKIQYKRHITQNTA